MWNDNTRAKEKGFTFLELAVVITIISALAVVALDRYYKLLVDVERTSMEHDLGVMRSAISLQVAGHYVAGNMAGLNQLAGSNPVDLLAEKPNNYLGVLSPDNGADVEDGSWYYHPRQQALIYRVRNRLYFDTELTGTPRARFKIVPVYSERKKETDRAQYLSGLRLKAVEPYRWLSPWDKD